MKIKEVFEQAENGVLTYDQFLEAAKAAGANFVDLKEGGYVSANKYQDELAAKIKEIETLNSTMSTRDADLEGLKKQLEEAGADAGKLEELTASLKELQTKYDGDTKAYKEQLKKQAYEFAVKEFANSKDFSSKAAKRDFIQSMIAKDLKMDGDKILGADDFVASYSEDNADAFIEEYNYDDDYSDGGGEDDFSNAEIPYFADTTPGAPSSPETGGFNFQFQGVRPMPNNS